MPSKAFAKRSSFLGCSSVDEGDKGDESDVVEEVGGCGEGDADPFLLI